MSGSTDIDAGAGRDLERAGLVALLALGAWAVIVPYLGPLLGLELDVAGSVEVVDHVVPGAVIIAASATGLALKRGPGEPSDTTMIAAVALAFLASFWVTSTHVPLIAEASRGESPWGAAILHNSAGLPVLAVAGAMLVGPLLRVPGRES